VSENLCFFSWVVNDIRYYVDDEVLLLFIIGTTMRVLVPYLISVSGIRYYNSSISNGSSSGSISVFAFDNQESATNYLKCHKSLKNKVQLLKIQHHKK
jgi:hypothetical protein